MRQDAQSPIVRRLLAGGIRWTVHVEAHRVPRAEHSPLRSYVWFTHGAMARVASVDRSVSAIAGLDDSALRALLSIAIPAIAG